MNCGHVMGPTYAGSGGGDASPVTSAASQAPSASGGEGGGGGGLPPNVLQAREIIADVCARFYCESTCLIDTVLYIFLEVSGLKLSYEGSASMEEAEEQRKRDHMDQYWRRCEYMPAPESSRDWSPPGPLATGRPLINMTSIACRAKLAYALLEALARQGAPRSPVDVAMRLDVLPRHILAVENKCCKPTTYSCPSQYMERICGFLGVPYYVGALARQLCVRVEDDYYGFQPEALVSACVLAVIDKIREKENSSFLFEATTLDTVTETVGISREAVQRCLKMLPPFRLRRTLFDSRVNSLDGDQYAFWSKHRSPYALCDVVVAPYPSSSSAPPSPEQCGDKEEA